MAIFRGKHFSIVNFHTMSLEEKIRQVESFYISLDQDLASFQSESKLSCLSGCSACCRSPEVETTILELLPFAFHLYKENRAEEFYEELLKNTSAICALYKPLQSIQKKGGCADYPYRAMICRLFGFSFTHDKEAKPQLLTCKEIKAQYPEAYEKITKEAQEGKEVPLVALYHNKLSAIDHYLTQQQYPINEAMRLAIEIVMNHFHYTETSVDIEKNVS